MNTLLNLLISIVVFSQVRLDADVDGCECVVDTTLTNTEIPKSSPYYRDLSYNYEELDKDEHSFDVEEIASILEERLLSVYACSKQTLKIEPISLKRIPSNEVPSRDVYFLRSSVLCTAEGEESIPTFYECIVMSANDSNQPKCCSAIYCLILDKKNL